METEDYSVRLDFQTHLVKTFKEVDKVVMTNARVDCPLEESEIAENPELKAALKSNFVKVPERSSSVVESKAKKLKHVGNFVRAVYSRSKSSKKMGKTMCPKKKFRYFQSNHLDVQEGKKIVYSSGFHNKVRSDETEISEILKHEFGFESFRPGQLESIQNILQGQNTLTILPTGEGKSLIYQISSRLLGGLVIVVSPLISLITDQIIRLPSCLSAAALVSGLDYSQYQQIITCAKQGKLDILFITPERFISEFIYQIPNISLICIDEAHCISKYSTSNRFSYMILPKYLKSLRVLALTGSIDQKSQLDVMSLLNISKVVKHGRAFRTNLKVTVSREDDILTFAGKIIRSEKYKRGAIIFYCNLQYLTDSVAQWIRSIGETCQSYHSGLSEQRRQMVQEDFSTGKVRILVATVSFGMGINKSNVAAVIHLHLPASIEQFIQESGRAGRNGQDANVHVVVSESTLYYQRSLIYANHITKRHILAFGKILRPSLKRRRDSDQSTPYIYIQINEFIAELGLNKETLLEILNYFEQRSLISNISVSPLNVNISFHKTQPEELSNKYAIISHILTTGKKLATSRRIYLPDLCQKLGLNIKDTVKVIKRLAATGEINAEFMDEGFELTCFSFPVEMELLDLATETEKYFQETEEILRAKIETCFLVFDKVAEDCFQDCKDVYAELSDLVEEYIEGKLKEEMPLRKIMDEQDIKGDVLCIAPQFDGIPDAKDITCILQGINTERTPYSRWKSYFLWSRYRKFRFLDVYGEVSKALMDGHEMIDKKIKVGERAEPDEIVESED